MAKDISFTESFFKMMVQPGDTFKTLIEKDPGYGRWVLVPLYCLLGGFSPIVFMAFSRFLGPWAAIPAQILLMAVFGISCFWLCCLLYFMVGKWLGGKGTLLEVSTACAWAYVPAFPAIVLMRLGEIPRWTAIFGGETDIKVVMATGQLWALTTILFAMIFMFWSLGLFVLGLSVAHRFSIGRAIGVFAIIFGVLIFLVIVAVVVGIVLFHVMKQG